MKVLPSVSAYVSIPKPIFHVLLILFFALSLFAQDYPNSVGPAPQSDYDISSEPVPFQIGTRYFAQFLVSPNFQFGRAFMESCSISSVGTPFPITFPGGLLYRIDIVYTWNQSAPFQVWRIDTVSGVHTIHFPALTGVPQANLTGMCWDGGYVYGVSTSLSSSQIFTINWLTGVCTPIGAPSAACAGAIFLLGRLGAGRGIFSADIVSDNLFKWNKTTGAATLVGPLGADFNFGQDGSVDPNDNTFYWSAYSTGPELRKLDTNGSSVVLCNYQSQVTGIACVPHGYQYPITTVCRNGLYVHIWDYAITRDSVYDGLIDVTILDVNVRIDSVFHTWDSDLRFYLQKGSVGSRIINWVGGSGDNFIGTVLDDEASVPIANGTAPFAGSFIPSGGLSAFDTIVHLPSYWRLLITDTAAGDTGLLRAWCLVIQYRNNPDGIVNTLEIPNYYFLNQNYPNPFNPTTIIKFGIPETENVKLIIYDVLGREVKTLLDEVKYPGTYVVDFDGTNLSSGIYFYKLETPNFVQVKKMLLVK